MSYPFELIRKRLRGFNEFSFLVLVAVFNLKQFRLQLSLWDETHRHHSYQSITNKAVKVTCHHCVKTTTWSYLVYHQRLDLAFEDLHASSSNNWPHIWDYALTENLADQTVVALETSCSWVLYGKPIVIIWRQEKHLSCYSSRGKCIFFFFIHLSKGWE